MWVKLNLSSLLIHFTKTQVIKHTNTPNNNLIVTSLFYLFYYYLIYNKFKNIYK